MSRALSIAELAELLAGTWKTEEGPSFQNLDALPIARADQAEFIETGFAVQGAGGGSVPRHFAPSLDHAQTSGGLPVPDEDPIRAAWTAGFENGVATEKRLALEGREQDLEAIGLLQGQVRQIDTESIQQIEIRMREAVIALCRQVIDDCPIPVDRLAERIRTAVKMIVKPHNERTICVNPADLPLLTGSLPAEWKLVGSPDLPRGGMRVATAEGGIEDGPEQWKLALEEAIRTC